MDRLDELEAQSVFIFREAFARLKKLALLWSLEQHTGFDIGEYTRTELRAARRA